MPLEVSGQQRNDAPFFGAAIAFFEPADEALPVKRQLLHMMAAGYGLRSAAAFKNGFRQKSGGGNGMRFKKADGQKGYAAQRIYPVHVNPEGIRKVFIDGNKVYDLYLRMEEDVLDKNPDVVVIYIGVNDVWHKATSGTGTDPDKFERFYTAIIKKLQGRNIKVIVCTPAVIGEKFDNSNQQDGDLNRYSQIIRTVAKNNNVPVCDLRKAFMEYEASNNPDNKESGILTKDRVHLTDKGNQLVADLLMPLIQK